LLQVASSVIGSFGVFAHFKIQEYNRKAGSITPDYAIENLVMKRQGGSYQARKETLKEAFQAYDESQRAAIACIINGSIHEPGNNKLQQNRKEALQFAQGLDPHRLFTNPRDFGRLLGRVSAHLTIMNYLKQRRAAEVQGLRQGRAGPSPSGQDQPFLGPQQRVSTEDSGLVSGMSRRAGPVSVSSLTEPGPVGSPAEANDPKLLKKTLFIPHTTQLLGTFLMAGIASDKDLENHLVRCGTGEGKSVCLGLTATVFALLGFQRKPSAQFWPCPASGPSFSLTSAA
jgi:hypothetical protein